MKKSVIIVVRGRVQGVFFRASAAEKAAELRLAGFVRNEPDGSVYMEAEGDETTEELTEPGATLHLPVSSPALTHCRLISRMNPTMRIARSQTRRNELKVVVVAAVR